MNATWLPVVSTSARFLTCERRGRGSKVSRIGRRPANDAMTLLVSSVEALFTTSTSHSPAKRSSAYRRRSSAIASGRLRFHVQMATLIRGSRVMRVLLPSSAWPGGERGVIPGELPQEDSVLLDLAVDECVVSQRHPCSVSTHVDKSVGEVIGCIIRDARVTRNAPQAGRLAMKDQGDSAGARVSIGSGHLGGTA